MRNRRAGGRPDGARWPVPAPVRVRSSSEAGRPATRPAGGADVSTDRFISAEATIFRHHATGRPGHRPRPVRDPLGARSHPDGRVGSDHSRRRARQAQRPGRAEAGHRCALPPPAPSAEGARRPARLATALRRSPRSGSRAAGREVDELLADPHPFQDMKLLGRVSSSRITLRSDDRARWSVCSVARAPLRPRGGGRGRSASALSPPCGNGATTRPIRCSIPIPPRHAA